jgi:hypothetical protein
MVQKFAYQLPSADSQIWRVAETDRVLHHHS